MALEHFKSAVRLRSSDEGNAADVQIIHPCVFDVTAVHDDGVSGLECDILACRFDVVRAAFGNDRELREIASDVDRCMQFYRTFSMMKPCPRAETQTEFDRR